MRMNINKNLVGIFLCGIFLWSGCSRNAYREWINRIPAEATGTWLISASDTIGDVSSHSPTHQITLDMAKGESEHFQLAVAILPGNQYAIERIGEQSEGLPSSIREVIVFDRKEDVLRPLVKDSVTATDTLFRLWVTYTTDTLTTAGIYRDIIRITDGETDRLVHVTIQVHDVTIPVTPSIPAVFGINPDKISADSLNGEKRYQQQKDWSDLLLGYRISPYFSTWLDGTMRVENTSSPYPIQDSRSYSYLMDKRFKRIAMPYHSLNEEEFKTMASQLRETGLEEKTYFYVWDEPTLMDEYARIGDFSKRIYQYLPGSKVITSFYCGPKDGPRRDDLFGTFDLLRDATKIYCTGVWSLQTREERSDSCRNYVSGEEEWWTYVCMSDTPGLAHSSTPIQNRAVLWRTFKEQSTGFLYWVVNSYDSLRPLKPRADLPHGDGILVYPGEEFGSNGLLVSARLERWRDGAEDYELLKQVEEKYGREKALRILSTVYTNPCKQAQLPQDIQQFKKLLLEQLK